MARKETVKRFEAWKLDPSNIDEFFAHIEGTGGRKAVSFRDATFAVKVPYTLMYSHVHGDERLKARYEGALKAKADELAQEALEIADGVKPDKDHIAKAKLRIDQRNALASKWDDERYGNRVRVDKTVSVSVDAGLLGAAGDLLNRVSARRPITIENEAGRALDSPEVSADPPSVAVPARLAAEG